MQRYWQAFSTIEFEVSGAAVLENRHLFGELSVESNLQLAAAHGRASLAPAVGAQAAGLQAAGREAERSTASVQPRVEGCIAQALLTFSCRRCGAIRRQWRLAK